MKCHICGGADLVVDTRDLPHTYKGETTVIAGVHGSFCPACGEAILDAAESQRVSVTMVVFNKSVAKSGTC